MNQAAMQPAGAFKHNLLSDIDEAGEVGKEAVHLCTRRYTSLEEARLSGSQHSSEWKHRRQYVYLIV